MGGFHGATIECNDFVLPFEVGALNLILIHCLADFFVRGSWEQLNGRLCGRCYIATESAAQFACSINGHSVLQNFSWEENFCAVFFLSTKLRLELVCTCRWLFSTFGNHGGTCSSWCCHSGHDDV